MVAGGVLSVVSGLPHASSGTRQQTTRGTQ